MPTAAVTVRAATSITLTTLKSSSRQSRPRETAPSAGEDEDGGHHDHQFGRFAADELAGDGGADRGGDQAQHEPGEEAGHQRRLDVLALDRLALDQGAAVPLEGEDHRQREEDGRHQGLAEAARRDQAGHDDGGEEGDEFTAEARGRRPADPADGGVLQLRAGELALGIGATIHLGTNAPRPTRLAAQVGAADERSSR